MISTVLQGIGAALLFVGLLLITISLYGLFRMTDTHSQLHAQGVATGPGVIAVLASSVATENAAIITFAVLAITFIAITSPTASNAIARAAHRRGESDAPIADRRPEP
jgi:monovalent cation/proton antiporter MnhG/PhaG subunit